MPTLSPVDPSFASTASRRVVVERTVEAPVENVWAVLTDNQRWPSWFPGMSSCDGTSQPPGGVGATRTVKVGQLVAEESFISWDVNQLWGFTIVRTNLPLASKMLEQVELIESSGSTLVRYTGAFEPHVLTRLIAGFVERQIRASWTDGLAGLETQAKSIEI